MDSQNYSGCPDCGDNHGAIIINGAPWAVCRNCGTRWRISDTEAARLRPQDGILPHVAQTLRVVTPEPVTSRAVVNAVDPFAKITLPYSLIDAATKTGLRNAILAKIEAEAEHVHAVAKCERDGTREGDGTWHGSDPVVGLHEQIASLRHHWELLRSLDTGDGGDPIPF